MPLMLSRELSCVFMYLLVIDCLLIFFTDYIVDPSHVMHGTGSGGMPLRTGSRGPISGSNLGSATSYLSDVGHLTSSQFLFFKIFPGVVIRIH